MPLRALALILWLASVQAHALELAGVTVEPRSRVGGETLVLNGAGVRSMFLFKVYVAALYVPAPSDRFAQIADQPGAKRLQLTLLRDVDGERLLNGMHEGLRKNLGAQEQAALAESIERFSAILRSLGNGRKGDRIALDWIPGEGTVVRINDVPHGPPLAGEAFYRALLRIWLGDAPAQPSLKDALLGHKG
jgi:long-chain acyl-CoA synthetase